MGVTGTVLVALLLIELGWAVYLLVAAARVSPAEPAARFRRGWLGPFGLMLSLSSGAGLAAVLAANGVDSMAGLAAAVALNVALQPVALLLCWAGIRKIALGLCGQVAYAWQRIPDMELADVPPNERVMSHWLTRPHENGAASA